MKFSYVQNDIDKGMTSKRRIKQLKVWAKMTRKN